MGLKYQISNSRYQILLLLLIGATLVSCRPHGILHSGEMRDVMVDLHKTDALLQLSGLQRGQEETRAIYYAQVLEKHGVTQAQFDSSLVWYTAHPQLFDKIYPKVLKELQEQEEVFLATNAKELNALVIPTPNTPKKPKQERTFKREDLDSILWVMQHGGCNSWEKWERKQPIPLVTP